MMHIFRKFVFVAALISFSLFNINCKSKKKKGREDIVREFDSLNRELDNINDKYNDLDSLYKIAVSRYAEAFLDQFYLTLKDAKGYLTDLKFRFIQFCGDSAGESIPMKNFDNTKLAHDFFSKDNGQTLYMRLKDVQRTLMSHNDDPSLDEKIKAMTGPGKEGDVNAFVQTYFSDVPPVAAMTILSKFENDIRDFEIKVLQNLLKDPHVTPQ